MPSSSGSVTDWLGDLRDRADPVASQRLWERYIAQLIRVARQKLGGAPRRVADEEDVAAAAFASFYRGVEANRFAQLNDRDDLWQILLVLTERKALNQIRHELAQRRGAGKVLSESVMDDAAQGAGCLADVADPGPTPAFAIEVSEQLEHLLQSLGEPRLRQIALLKLEGCTNREIAERLSVSLRSVERRLALIRGIWQE
jgi:RNA polymerase sigma factor (sigma-70 family)